MTQTTVEAQITGKRKWWRVTSFLLLIILIMVMIIAAGTGPARISPVETVTIICLELSGAGRNSSHEWSDTTYEIIFQIRLPRVILAALVGAGLAVCGVVLQGLMKNPMADPYVLGISSGAAFGAVLAILFGFGTQTFGFDDAVPVAAFAGGLGTVLTVYAIARLKNRVDITTLLLAGIAVGSLMSSLTSLAMVVSGAELHRVVFWLMGGLAGATWKDVIHIIPYFIVGAFPIYAFSKDLNIMLLGEESAAQLGVNVEKVKLTLLAAASLVTATAVSVSGIIGFVGLIIPHGVRFLVGPDHRVLIPSAAMFGAIFLVIADTVARTAGGTMEIPVGVITAMCGAPFFVYLLLRKSRSYV